MPSSGQIKSLYCGVLLYSLVLAKYLRNKLSWDSLGLLGGLGAEDTENKANSSSLRRLGLRLSLEMTK